MVYLLIGASGIFHALLRVWEILEFDFLEFGPTVSYLSSFFGELKVNLWDHIGIIVPPKLKVTYSTTKVS